MTCIDNMDSTNMSELNIIQESSDAGAKELDRPMYSGPKVREPRGPRPKIRSLRPELRDPRGPRP